MTCLQRTGAMDQSGVMRRRGAVAHVRWIICGAIFAASLLGCKSKDEGATAPPPTKVVEVQDMNLITVAKPEQFRLSLVDKIESAAEFDLTGTVVPDIAREVPVISLANGRVVDIKARLDDNVKKGQLLLRVQSPDITNAFNAYLKATNDEQLANRAYLRAEDLYKHGAIAQAMVEQAEDTEKNAKANLTAAEEQLATLGVDKHHPSSVVDVRAPISGVIVAQNANAAGAAGVGLSGSATTFTVADLSVVWIICDANENDIPKLQLGQQATVHFNAYPDKAITGRISDIGPVLDPAIRTAKVRLEVKNPGFMKLGMFVTARFVARTKEMHPVVPAEAVLHLHDRDWVFVPIGGSQFRRTEVKAGRMMPGSRQVILLGIQPGQQVVANALSLESAGNQ